MKINKKNKHPLKNFLASVMIQNHSSHIPTKKRICIYANTYYYKYLLLYNSIYPFKNFYYKPEPDIYLSWCEIRFKYFLFSVKCKFYGVFQHKDNKTKVYYCSTATTVLSVLNMNFS